jgi:DNA-directed RNA polymerase specialized sigma24 family protein
MNSTGPGVRDGISGKEFLEPLLADHVNDCEQDAELGSVVALPVIPQEAQIESAATYESPDKVFEDLFAKVKRQLARIAFMTKTGPSVGRDDLLQEAALKIWQHGQKEEDITPALALTIGRRRMVDISRAHTGRMGPMIELANLIIDELAEGKSRQEAMESILGKDDCQYTRRQVEAVADDPYFYGTMLREVPVAGISDQMALRIGYVHYDAYPFEQETPQEFIEHAIEAMGLPSDDEALLKEYAIAILVNQQPYKVIVEGHDISDSRLSQIFKRQICTAIKNYARDQGLKSVDDVKRVLDLAS